MKRSPRVLVGLFALALAVTACGDDDDDDDGGAGGGDGQSFEGQTIEVAAIWTGEEQARFTQVLDAWEEDTGATVQFTPTGDNVSTFLGSRIEGGAPPDVAILPQQGVLVQLAEQGVLKPLPENVQQAVSENFAGVWADLGSHNGTQYGVYFKAANKSTFWYRTDAFQTAGIEAPTTDAPWTWDQFLQNAGTVSDAGLTPVSIGGGDGWTLTDWFENVYLSQAGPDMYDQLAAHEIPWTDPSVITALETLGQLWGNSELIAPNPLQTPFPDSVINVFGGNPSAAMVYEGDFVANVIGGETESVVGEDANFFPFPLAGDNQGVVGGGDVAVALTDSPATFGLLEFLASPEAGEIWAGLGGFTSPNQNVDLSVYPDDVSRAIAQQLIEAGDNFRFDMSDLAPAAFGGTVGQGMWGDLQNFLGDPSNPQAAAEQLEADAAEAYGN